MTAAMEYNRELTLDELENICGGVSETQSGIMASTGLPGSIANIRIIHSLRI